MKTRLFGLCLLLAAGAAMADGVVSVTRLTDPAGQDFELMALLPPDCSGGNFQNDHLFLVEHTFQGEYFVDFDLDVDCDCLGFRVSAVHLLLATGISAAGFQMQVGWFTRPYVPHVVVGMPWVYPIELSDVMTVQLEAFGVYDVSIAFSGDECAYPHPDYPSPFYNYNIFVGFPDTVSDLFGIASTNPGAWSFNFGGVSEECGGVDQFACDLIEDYDWPGEIVMWAETECCYPPVRSESRTWGEIKGLYR